jgi:hypothetical protein
MGCPYQVVKITAPYCTIYMITVYLFTQGRGGGARIEPERRLEEQQFKKLGQNANRTDCISRL